MARLGVPVGGRVRKLRAVTDNSAIPLEGTLWRLPPYSSLQLLRREKGWERL